MDDIFQEQLSKRLTQLRIQANVSAREVSLSIGQDESYINKVENKRILPSMEAFGYICDYFGIAPKDFFDYEDDYPMETRKMLNGFQRLTVEQKTCIIKIIEWIHLQN